MILATPGFAARHDCPRAPASLAAVRHSLCALRLSFPSSWHRVSSHSASCCRYPFYTVFVWTNQHSVATIIWALYKNQELFLCFVIFMFSIFFPFLKLFYLLTLVTSPDMPHQFRTRSISVMEWLGRYSMTDVMVLALMIFYVNASGYTEASVLPGVYFFAASALMTMFAYGWANSVGPAQPHSASLQARLAELSQPTPITDTLVRR